jgi:BatD DUF11 like domain
MVSKTAFGIVGRLAIIASLFVAFSNSRAAIDARVDRARVEQNESFTLEIVIDANSDVVPDLTPLETDFVVGQTSQLSNTRIDNGAITRSMTWTITLMAKRAGTLTIPSLTVGNEQSNTVTIEVQEPAYQPPGEADVFITAEVDFDETYVQAQVLYTIKLYRAVSTRQPALRNAEFSGAEVLVEAAGEQRSYEAILNGRAYSVVENAFAIFPQESGEVSISPTRFEARVLRDGRITGRKVFESESVKITVKPIPPPPPDYPDARWLPAKDLTLTDNWSRDLNELHAGEPISRDITISALGQLETQIPIIDPPAPDGVSIYPDKPSLTRRLEPRGIRGERTDQYAMIGGVSGDVVMPGFDLPWWDVDDGEWRVAQLPAVTITILPSDDLPMPLFVDQAPMEAIDTTDAEPIVIQSEFWRHTSELLTAVWLLTLFGWWWSGRPRREEREPPPIPLHKQQAKSLKAARKAALAGDAPSVRHALLEWGHLQWPDNPPRNIDRIASGVSEPLKQELRRLSGVSYGPNDEEWNGEALAKALRSFSVPEEDDTAHSTDLLPPLMPNT